MYVQKLKKLAYIYSLRILLCISININTDVVHKLPKDLGYVAKLQRCKIVYFGALFGTILHKIRNLKILVVHVQLGIIYNIGDILQIGRFSLSGDNFVSASGECLFIGRQIFNQKNETVMRITVCICVPYNCRFQMEIKNEGDKPAFFDRCPAYLQS